MRVYRPSMFSFLVSALIAAVSVVSGAGCAAEPEKKQIAITFDDAPVMRFYTHPSQWHRTVLIDSLATTLEAFQAPATIFVVGDLIEEPEGAELLTQWMSRGVQIANHTMSHTSFNLLSIAEGIEEIDRASAILEPVARAYDQQIRYFRFPFLEEGFTPEKKSAWLEHLERRGLKNARVTVSNDDWKFDAEYAEAELAEDWALRYEIGQAYMEHMRASIAHWDSLGQELTGRNIRHVLLLHANRINRDYLPQILADLQERGFEFITLDHAYEDPIYRARDEWVSENGASFLENLKQTRMMYLETAARK
jgi:peptidoglycan/xylan/chitin deacetylase (PgdA/CDA1 family)